MSSAIIPGKTITYEIAFKILTSPTSPQKIKKRLTYQEVADKFKVPLSVVVAIKNGTFLKEMAKGQQEFKF